MDKVIKLGQDIVLLWKNYGSAYLGGVWNTLALATVATLIGTFLSSKRFKTRIYSSAV